MNVNRRDRRDQPGVTRGAGQRTPRSGGRTTAERTSRAGGGGPNSASEARVRGDRENPGRVRVRGDREDPTQGSAALQEREPAVEGLLSLRVWDSSGERPDRSEKSEATSRRAGVPRLRVAPPSPVAGPRASFVALILVLVVGGMLGILVVNSKVNENAFRLERLQQQQATLDIQQQQLEQEIADAEVPGNLAARARDLGLVESGPPAFIRLPDGRVIGVPQPATGEPGITSPQGAGG